jgi:hypothetical protein
MDHFNLILDVSFSRQQVGKDPFEGFFTTVTILIDAELFAKHFFV